MQNWFTNAKKLVAPKKSKYILGAPERQNLKQKNEKQDGV
jgi:hypothetical protein